MVVGSLHIEGIESNRNFVLHKVNRCLARYSPRATTTNRPTKFCYPYNGKPTLALCSNLFMVGHWTKCAKNGNIWPKQVTTWFIFYHSQMKFTLCCLMAIYLCKTKFRLLSIPSICKLPTTNNSLLFFVVYDIYIQNIVTPAPGSM